MVTLAWQRLARQASASVHVRWRTSQVAWRTAAALAIPCLWRVSRRIRVQHPTCDRDRCKSM